MEKRVVNKEVVLYLLFGGISFLLNILLFAVLNMGMGINELIANIFCWIACVLFQFVTNRLWVFDARTDNTKDTVTQMISFFGGRLFTLAVEEAIIFLFITWMGLPGVPVKLVAQVVVIVLNYVISKRIVFR